MNILYQGSVTFNSMGQSDWQPCAAPLGTPPAPKVDVAWPPPPPAPTWQGMNPPPGGDGMWTYAAPVQWGQAPTVYVANVSHQTGYPAQPAWSLRLQGPAGMTLSVTVYEP